MAFALPTTRVRRCVPPAPGMTPSLISGWPNFALSAAMMKSHIMASSQPPPSAKPGHRRDDRLAALADAVPGGDEVLEVGPGVALVLHLLDVGAGGEGLLRAGEDDAADAGIGLEAVERLVDLVDRAGRVQRVQRLRPVERDEPDLALRLDENGFISHGRPPRMLPCIASAKRKPSAADRRHRAAAGSARNRRSSGPTAPAAARAAAARRGAGLALAVIDPEAVLEIAERAVGMGVVAQASSRRPRPPPQHLADAPPGDGRPLARPAARRSPAFPPRASG